MFEKCPCGAGPSYLTCCAPLHLGQKTAETPEQLMRARYSAFVRGEAGFLMESWAPETRPASIGDLGGREWLGLTVRASGVDAPDQGWVLFEARFQEGGRAGTLRESSRFRREAGRWLYVDGRLG